MESQGCIYIFVVIVVIMFKLDDIEGGLDMSEVCVDIMCVFGVGGQYVNKIELVVCMIYLLMGIMVVCVEKFQYQNCVKVVELFVVKFYDMKCEVVVVECVVECKDQIGFGDCFECICIYNYLQGCVFDYCINLMFYKLDQIVVGDGLDEVVIVLIFEDQVVCLVVMEQDGQVELL